MSTNRDRRALSTDGSCSERGDNGRGAVVTNAPSSALMRWAWRLIDFLSGTPAGFGSFFTVFRTTRPQRLAADPGADPNRFGLHGIGGTGSRQCKKTAALLVVFLWIFQSANGAGLTIITHGFQPPGRVPILGSDGALPNWVREMAEAIKARVGAPVQISRIRYDKASGKVLLEDGATSIDITKEGGAIIMLDWVGVADETIEFPAQVLADHFSNFLFGQVHAGRYLMEIPIHLIGHSRGTSLNARISQWLAERGVIVDQVTTLDPHPVTPTSDLPLAVGSDSVPRTYVNVLFADNYFQTEDQPDGQIIAGAFDQNLNSVINSGELFKQHALIHTYYHATVDLGWVFDTVDSESLGPFWFTRTRDRDQTGFAFSRFGNLELKRNSVPLGLTEHLINGGGSGTRVPVDLSASAWSNAGFDQRLQHDTRAHVGRSFPISFYFADWDSEQTVVLFIDADTNPYNGIGSVIRAPEKLPPSTSRSIPQKTVAWIPTSDHVGKGFIGIATTDSTSGHVRYDYFLREVTVVPPDAPSTPNGLAAVAVSATQINVNWSGGGAGVVFKLERRQSSSSTWTTVTLPLGSASHYSDSSVTSGATYFYRVAATNGTSSPFSESASATAFSASSTMRTLSLRAVDFDSGEPIAVQVYTWLGLSTDTQMATTSFTRQFAANAQAKLACFPSVGARTFRYMQAGNEVHLETTWSIPMITDRQVTLVYGTDSSGTRTLSELTINGEATAGEGGSRTYSATARYTDGSSAQVTPQAWSVVQNGSPATISSGGVLDAGSVTADTLLTVEASYTEKGVTKLATKDIMIVNNAGGATYALNVAVSGQGQVLPTPNFGQFSAGSTVPLRAYPATNYRFTGWGGDASASGTTNPTTVTMDGNKNITATFVFDASYFGPVRVTLQPQGAAAAGAQWRLDNGPWQNSGATVIPDSNGSHTLLFSIVAGYAAPATRPITIVSGQTNEFTGSYVSQSGLGALQVTLLPQGVVDLGAQWRPQGGSYDWQASGATLQGVASGTYPIDFTPVPGWSLPPAQAVTVSEGGLGVASAIYGPSAGVPVVYSIGPKTGPIAGGTDVIIDGANFIGSVSVTFGGVNATTVTVESSSRIIARTPPSAAYRTVAVAVTAAGGSAASVANGFTYIVPRGEHMDLVGQIGGWVQAVAAQNNYLFVGEGSGFAVYSISNPASPTPSGRLPLPDMVRDIAVSGNYAYVAAGTAGFFIVDISVPTAPALKGFYDTAGTAEGVAVQGSVAYVADGGGLVILDCSDPAAPIVRSTLVSGGTHKRVTLMIQGASRYACVAATGAGLHTIDVTNPASPVKKSTFATPGDINDVAVLGTKAYVGNTAQQSLQIIDLTNPQQPALLGQFFGGSGESVAVQGTTAFLGGISGFKAINVTNAADPQSLGTNGTAVAKKIVLSSNYAYLAEADMGLRVVSIATPSNMTQVANLRSLLEVGDISVRGSMIYAAGGNNGFTVIDSSNPSLMRITGRLDFTGLNCMSVASSDTDMVFVGTTEGIKVVRANSSGPQLLTTFSPSKAQSLVYDGFLLAADYDDAFKPRFQVLENWTDSSTLKVYAIDQHIATLTNTAAEGSAFRAINWAGRAYLSDAGGVHVVDFARPTRMTRMGDAVTPGLADGLAVANSGKHLLVANRSIDASKGWNGGITIVDVQNGTAPVVVKTVLTGVEFLDVRVEGSLAYAGGRGNGIYVLDVTDVINPVVRAFYDTAGSADAVRVANGVVYVADRRGGLLSLRVLDFTAPAVAITAPTPTQPITTGSSTISISGTASDDKGVTSVTWANNRGGGGTASGTSSWEVAGIQLQPGVNVVTVTGSDAAGNAGTSSVTVNYAPPDTTAPVVRINYPTTAASIAANSQTIELRGTAADNAAVSAISWANNRGGSGVATGTTTWTASAIPLLEGPNVVTISAADSAGNTAASSITVTYAPPDTTPPSVVISFPTVNVNFQTIDSSLNLSGTAVDNRGVFKVSWSNNRGGGGSAAGTSTWSVNGLTLQPGLNVITVSAEDEAGNIYEDALAVTLTPPVAPTISRDPANKTVIAGQSATFDVIAAGTPTPSYQWQRSINGGASWSNVNSDSVFSGVWTSMLTINGATFGMSGNAFRVIASNGIAPDAVSNGAPLTVTSAPTITTEPIGQTVNAGADVSLTVAATGTMPLSYQWRKGGVARNGATNASLSFENAQPADSGSYDVIVSNGVSPDAISATATLNVVPTGVSATHSVASYVATATGGTVSISNRFAYIGAVTNLRWSVLLPSGWSFADTDASSADLKPAAGAIGLLEWRWSTLPSSPIAFNYSLNVPATDVAPQPLAALVRFAYEEISIQMMAKPDPLMVGPRHSADTDGDRQISLFELTRVIELYNTRNGTVRTGCYKVDATGEDGFAADLPRASGSTVALTRYHSADTRGGTTGSARDGAIDLFELTRVIELYNTRAGTVRTGAYHVQAGTEDGFAAGP